MATTANTFPIMQADLKDQFAKDNKFIPEYYSKITRKING